MSESSLRQTLQRDEAFCYSRSRLDIWPAGGNLEAHWFHIMIRKAKVRELLGVSTV